MYLFAGGHFVRAVACGAQHSQIVSQNVDAIESRGRSERGSPGNGCTDLSYLRTLFSPFLSANYSPANSSGPISLDAVLKCALETKHLNLDNPR